MSCIQSNRIYSKALFLVFTLALLIFTASPAPAQEEQGETIYEPGAALLEIFKAESMDNIPDLPIIRTLWKRDLTCWGDPLDRENPWRVSKAYSADAFLIPERASELGAKPGYEFSAPYVARISFYYEAKRSGKYSFTIMHSRNICELKIGGISIVDAQIGQPAAQGICKLEKGFHRVEFYLVSNICAGQISSFISTGMDPYFTVKVLIPDAFDAELITKGKLLMKSADSPRS